MIKRCFSRKLLEHIVYLRTLAVPSVRVISHGIRCSVDCVDHDRCCQQVLLGTNVRAAQVEAVKVDIDVWVQA